MKKLLSIVLAMVLMLSMGVSAMAQETASMVSSDTITSDQFSITRSQLSQEQRQLLDERLNEVMAGATGLKIGEVKEIGELGGDKLYIQVIEEENGSLARGVNTSSSKTFLTSYKNILGQTKSAFRVKLTCKWYNDGANSYIKSLTGAYTILDDSFSCEWDEAFGDVTEPGYHALFMYAYHGGESAWYIYDALCDTLNLPASISFGFSQN